jgi:hypothetical protein
MGPDSRCAALRSSAQSSFRNLPKLVRCSRSSPRLLCRFSVLQRNLKIINASSFVLLACLQAVRLLAARVRLDFVAHSTGRRRVVPASRVRSSVRLLRLAGPLRASRAIHRPTHRAQLDSDHYSFCVVNLLWVLPL